MSNLIKFLIGLAIGVAIFWFIVDKVGWNVVSQAFILFISLKGLAIIFLTFIISYLAVLRWQLILRSQGEDFQLTSLTKIWLVGYTISYLTPNAFLGGEIFRIYLSNKKLDLDYKKGTASVIIDKILDGTFFLLFAIVGVVAFVFNGNALTNKLAWPIVIIIWLLGGLLLLFYFKALNKESIMEWFLKIFGLKKRKIKQSKNGKVIFDTEKEIIRFFSPKKKAFWESITISFVRYLLYFLRTVMIIFFLRRWIAPSSALAIHGFDSLSLMLPLPAGLGGLEAASAFVFKSLGFYLSQGIVLALIWRSADLVICLFGIIFIVKYGMDLAQMKVLNFVDKLKQIK